MNKSAWFPYLQKRPDPKVRILCFHHSGASAAVYRVWPSFFNEEVEIIPVQLPGREARFSEPFISDISKFNESLLPQIIDLNDKPLVLFGHSLGGILAFNVALELEKRNCPPQKVFISACLPPHEIKQRSPIYDLSEKKFISVVKSYGGLPKAITENRDMLNLLLPRLRADFKLFETSTCLENSLIQTPICVFSAKKDSIAPSKKIIGWNNYTQGECISKVFHGDHFYYQTNTRELVTEISLYI